MGKSLFAKMTQTFYADAGEPEDRGPARIFFVNGLREGEFVEIGPGKASFGRGESNDIQLPSEVISKQHFFIEGENGEGYHLVDAKSRNGVFVNGRRIEAGLPFALTHGDSIAVADIEMLFLNNKQTVHRDYGREIELNQNEIEEEAGRLLEDNHDLIQLRRSRRQATRH